MQRRDGAAGDANPDCVPVMRKAGPWMDRFCADNTYTERFKDLPRLWRDTSEQYIGRLVALKRNIRNPKIGDFILRSV